MDPVPSTLTHLDHAGRARMVDVGEKPITRRSAVAEAIVRVSPELATRIAENAVSKGNVLEVARLAGIQAAKRTDELIPLCHTLPLDVVDVQAALEDAPTQGTGWPLVRLRAEVTTHARTGVEMEALVAASIAALTIIDMGKAVDRTMTIESIRVLEKRGGRSGTHGPAQPPRIVEERKPR
jgi:cyclic pyranopterin monophosphate synthase